MGCQGRLILEKVLSKHNFILEKVWWMGAFTEQYVLQQLLVVGLTPYYWSRGMPIRSGWRTFLL